MMSERFESGARCSGQHAKTVSTAGAMPATRAGAASTTPWLALAVGALLAALVLALPGGARAEREAPLPAPVAAPADDELAALAGPVAPVGEVRDLVRVGGEIGDNLYDTARTLGVPARIVQEMFRTFSHGIDFQREISSGDRFEAVWEQFTDDGAGTSRVGDLVHANITYGGETLALWRFAPEGGEAEFFDHRGRSIRSGLMRTPLDSARVSSAFGPRLHPILGYTRMHRGTDFAAARGTPVYAAGDGVVELARRNGGYGNCVRLVHGDDMKTTYAHLQGFADGIREGALVSQGQVIGYVGSSGRSTGPHLHFEVQVAGEPIDPMTVDSRPTVELAGRSLALFRWHASLLAIRPVALPAPALRQDAGRL